MRFLLFQNANSLEYLMNLFCAATLTPLALLGLAPVNTVPAAVHRPWKWKPVNTVASPGKLNKTAWCIYSFQTGNCTMNRRNLSIFRTSKIWMWVRIWFRVRYSNFWGPGYCANTMRAIETNIKPYSCCSTAQFYSYIPRPSLGWPIWISSMQPDHGVRFWNWPVIINNDRYMSVLLSLRS